MKVTSNAKKGVCARPRGWGMCSEEVAHPVEKQTKYTGASRAALLHPYVNVKGSGYRPPHLDH